jgi:hypothetical protein
LCGSAELPDAQDFIRVEFSKDFKGLLKDLLSLFALLFVIFFTKIDSLGLHRQDSQDALVCPYDKLCKAP